MKTEADALVERIGQGDQVAAVDLVDLFYERVYAFLRRLCYNDADAADLTQRTFGRVWQALPTFAGRSSFSSWIHGIAHHVYLLVTFESLKPASLDTTLPRQHLKPCFGLF